jgi:hypothetical protein
VSNERLKIGVLMPSPNTATESAFALISPSSVALHYSRILIGGQTLIDSDANIADILLRVRPGMNDSIRSIVTMIRTM